MLQEYSQGVNTVGDPTWGDNGKGKVIDLMGQYADMVIRYNGGPNAGHTVKNELGEFKFHLMPSGIFNPDAVSILANTVVVDPFVLEEEIIDLTSKGVTIKDEQLLISRDATMLMPWHKVRDQLAEQARGAGKIGTTGRGVGPAYSDRTAREGLRVGDLLRPDFEEKFLREFTWQSKLIGLMMDQGITEEQFFKLSAQFDELSIWQYNQQLRDAIENGPFDVDQLLHRMNEAAESLGPRITNTLPVIRKAFNEEKNILGEPGQGVLLDLEFGSVPNVTSSHPGIEGFGLATGIHANKVRNVVGVNSVYSKRVGSGPLPTELHDEVGDKIREIGHEYGVTTGRPRRCGWLDVPALRRGIEYGGVTELALTKLDVLDTFPEIKICTAYRVGSNEYDFMEDASPDFMEHVVPVYETFKGWEQDTTQVDSYNELPENAKRLVERIEGLTGTPVRFVGVGPDREATIMR